MRSIIPDFLMLAGIGCISYGSWLIFQPAGFIAGGFLALVLGVLTARVKSKKQGN